MIAGVSGGSVTAAYYAAFGDELFTRFESEFLRRDFQHSLVAGVLRPDNLARMSSPWFGRSHVLAESLHALYRGRTFGDLAARPQAPVLLVSATDLSLGSFDFSPERFALICSDPAQVPLSDRLTSRVGRRTQESAPPPGATETETSRQSRLCSPGQPPRRPRGLATVLRRACLVLRGQRMPWGQRRQ